MWPPPESKVLARAMRELARKNVQQHGTKFYKAIVQQVNPLAVEIATADLIVDEDSLLLGAWPRAYDKRYGLAVGDTVMMTQLDDGDWYVVDVMSLEDFNLGDHPDLRTASAFNTGSGHVVGQIPYKAQDGTTLGVLLVYDNATLRDFLGHDSVNSNPVVPN